jgi:hypothetical protein
MGKVHSKCINCGMKIHYAIIFPWGNLAIRGGRIAYWLVLCFHIAVVNYLLYCLISGEGGCLGGNGTTYITPVHLVTYYDK